MEVLQAQLGIPLGLDAVKSRPRAPAVGVLRSTWRGREVLDRRLGLVRFLVEVEVAALVVVEAAETIVAQKPLLYLLRGVRVLARPAASSNVDACAPESVLSD